MSFKRARVSNNRVRLFPQLCVHVNTMILGYFDLRMLTKARCLCSEGRLFVSNFIVEKLAARPYQRR